MLVDQVRDIVGLYLDPPAHSEVIAQFIDATARRRFGDFRI